jgi:hypothetical protein
MKNPFKKPKAEPKAKVPPKKMKVYLSGYRVGQVHHHLVQPGLKEPDVREWFNLIPIPALSPAALENQPGVIRTPTGQTARLDPKSFTVTFRDGMAEVEQRLATFLIGEGSVFAKPQKPCNWTDPTRYAPAEAEA